MLGSWKDGWRDRTGIPCTGHRKRSEIVHKIIFSSRFALRLCAFVSSCKMNYIHYSKANFVLAVICTMANGDSTEDRAYYRA